MEILEIIVIVMSCGIISMSVMFFSKMKGGKRKVSGAKETAVESAIEVMQHALNAHKAEIKRLSGQNSQLKRKIDEFEGMEQEGEERKDKVTFEQISEIAKAKGINPLLLTPFKDVISKLIEGKTIAEIDGLIKQFEPSIRNFKPQANNQQNEFDESKLA